MRPGHAEGGDRHEEGELPWAGDPGVLDVEAPGLGVAEEALDSPALSAEIEGGTGRLAGRHDQPVACKRLCHLSKPCIVQRVWLQINGLFKAEVIHRRGPWRSLEDVEFDILEWVDWFNSRRLFRPIGNIPPAETEKDYCAALETEASAA